MSFAGCRKISLTDVISPFQHLPFTRVSKGNVSHKANTYKYPAGIYAERAGVFLDFKSEAVSYYFFLFSKRGDGN